MRSEKTKRCEFRLLHLLTMLTPAYKILLRTPRFKNRCHRCCYALYSTSSARLEAEFRREMTVVGYAVTTLMQADLPENIKLDVVKVATLMPREFAGFLAVNSAVPSIVKCLEDVLVDVVEVKGGR